MRTYKSKNLEVITYGYEGRNMNWMRKVIDAENMGNECFEHGKYVYEVSCLSKDDSGIWYQVEKYLKTDCIQTAPGVWLIDSPTRMFCGNLVANVWRSKND